jgi:hypothetical protein
MRDRLPMILSATALVVAVLGATPLGEAAYNAVAPRSVGTAQLKNNSITAQKLRKGSVTNAKLRGDAVTSGKVKNRSLRAIDFKLGQLPAGPRGPQGAKGDKGDAGAPGAASAKTVAVPNVGDLTSATAGQLIASLPLSAGSYIITAQAKIAGRQTTAGDAYATCTLAAGTDEDTVRWHAYQNATSAAGVLVLSVLHTFTATGIAQLKCGDSTSQPSALSGARITAVQVQAIG